MTRQDEQMIARRIARGLAGGGLKALQTTMFAVAGIGSARFAFAAGDTGLDAIAGNTGWLGAGILGAVLGWLLMWHLPAKDKQLENFIAGKDVILKDVIAANAHAITGILDKFDKTIAVTIDQYTVALERQRQDFRETMEIVQGHCAREVEGVTAATARQLEALTEAIRAIQRPPVVGIVQHNDPQR